MVERFATVDDVKRHANSKPTPIPEDAYNGMHVWGPILAHDGKSVGALGAAASVCLRPILSESLLDRVRAEVPEDLRICIAAPALHHGD